MGGLSSNYGRMHMDEALLIFADYSVFFVFLIYRRVFLPAKVLQPRETPVGIRI
jgi:hypothetical protein